jgi:dipeptidyl aminopeptidase/acylaminoacyl peptidase
MPVSRRLARAVAAATLALLFTGTPALAQDAKVIDAFTRLPNFTHGEISPDGQYVAFTVPLEDSGVVAVFRRSDLKQVGAFNLGDKQFVGNMVWVNPQRLVMSVAKRDGFLNTPYFTGELAAMDFDGTDQRFLTGQRTQTQQVGSHITVNSNEEVFADLIERFPGKDDSMLVSNTPAALDVATTIIRRMDADTGKLVQQTVAPIPYADVLGDNAGQARFAEGWTRSAVHQLHYRTGEDGDWTLVNDEAASGVRMWALGFDAAQTVAYLKRENKTGPASIVAYSLADGTMTEVVRDARFDPTEVLYGRDDRTVLAVGFHEPKLRWHFIDTTSPDAMAMRALVKAFPDHEIYPDSMSADGSTVLVYALNDRDSGAYYVYDTAKKSVAELIVAQSWLDPAGMAPVRTLEVKARDGRALQALLTLPKSPAGGAKPPLVVLPHGGPYGEMDGWSFDGETQLLAAHGFAVLRVNFRGSGGYGRDFELAGYQQLGGAMQDDITDATRAAIADGHVDGNRVCIYGEGVGAYAAMMGPAREPGLYKCAAGYVGVYDLVELSKGDNKTRLQMQKKWTVQVLGTDEARLKATSPTLLAAQIKVPVFLAGGGRDETFDHHRHSVPMRNALTAAGNAPKWLYFPGEGHGYANIEHQRQYYRELIAFLNENFGLPVTAAPPAPATTPGG